MTTRKYRADKCYPWITKDDNHLDPGFIARWVVEKSIALPHNEVFNPILTSKGDVYPYVINGVALSEGMFNIIMQVIHRCAARGVEIVLPQADRYAFGDVWANPSWISCGLYVSPTVALYQKGDPICLAIVSEGSDAGARRVYSPRIRRNDRDKRNRLPDARQNARSKGHVFKTDNTMTLVDVITQVCVPIQPKTRVSAWVRGRDGGANLYAKNQMIDDAKEGFASGIQRAGQPRVAELYDIVNAVYEGRTPTLSYETLEIFHSTRTRVVAATEIVETQRGLREVGVVCFTHDPHVYLINSEATVCRTWDSLEQLHEIIQARISTLAMLGEQGYTPIPGVGCNTKVFKDISRLECWVYIPEYVWHNAGVPV